MKRSKRYGWKRDLPDFRDKPYMALSISLDQLPEQVDLSLPSMPILSQEDLGSCTANALSSAHLYEQHNQKKESPFQPSRLFIYYNERVMIGMEDEDSGAYIRDGIKTMVSEGVCREETWPYRTSRFRSKPDEECYKEALNYQVVEYARLQQSLYLMKCCLFSGHPFVFGFSVYESFESNAVAKTGIIPMPRKSESLLGGHAVSAEGYDNRTKYIKCRNSHTKNHGDEGYLYLPYEYISNPDLAADFWKITLVE